MQKSAKEKDDITLYINDQEYIANNYVMKCFTVTMLVYTTAFVLNILGIFVIRQDLMLKAYIPSVMIYLASWIVSRMMSPSNKIKKYIILSGSIYVFTITGVFITYHAILVTLLPFLYAALYSSKRVMTFVYIMTTVSTVIIVYGGYYFGLCDANMALLTTGSVSDYLVNGVFTLTEVNPNPLVNLFLFFVLPRCLIYVAFMAVCNSIFTIVSGSLEKARLNAELEQAKEEAERANQAKTKFLARMSHEIRTPINAIFGMNEMIVRESSEPAIQKYAKDIKDSSELLLDIVNDILDSSKIESGMMELVENEYKIGSLIHDLYNITGVKAKEKNLELEFDIDPEIPGKLYGDDKRIKQIILNLLSNAVKYTNQGKVVLKMTWDKKGEDAVLYVSVKDTGIGIKEDDIDRLYDEFRRLDVERNRNIEGTGLGMAIARQFLKMMGSELEIQSEYEKGSEFSFRLVQKIIDETPVGDIRVKVKDSEENQNHSVCFTAAKAKVMVVDDYKMNLKVFKNLLKSTGIQVCEAESGKECIQILREQQFDLIFLDHMMPEMDGIETLHVIREEKLCENVPVIMLTANALVGDRERYMQEGFDDFLTKPIIPDKLDDMLLKHLPSEYVVYLKEEKMSDVIKVLPEEHYDAICKKLPELDYTMGLSTCVGDKDFYLELLNDFSELPIKEELNKFLKEEDANNYCIKVHGFKNNAYSVGAKEIGDLAYKLEKITKEGMTAEVAELQKQMFELYDNVCKRYSEVVVTEGTK